MKHIRKLCIAATLMCAGALFAQAAPEKVLEPGDVEIFLKTMPMMYKELAALEITYDVISGESYVPTGVSTIKALKAIEKKYGWDDRFPQKLHVIVRACFLLVYSKEAKNADEVMKKAVAEIENSKKLTPEQKKKYIDDLRKRMANAPTAIRDPASSVHRDDLAFVKPHTKALTDLFKSLGGDEGRSRGKTGG